MRSLEELFHSRKENPYFDWLAFYSQVIPWLKYSPHRSIEHNLEGIADRGHWSEVFAKKLESIYEMAAGGRMQDQKKNLEKLHADEEANQTSVTAKELKQSIRRGLTLISYFLRAVNNSVHHNTFDLELFQDQFTKIYVAYGSETTRWFCVNYADVLKGGYDPVEYVRCIDSVAQVGGRESISIFSAGFRPLMQHESYYGQRTEPGPFVSAINRVIERTGSRWYALTFALSAKYAQAHQISLDELEARVTDWGKEFDPQLTKKITDAFFEFYRVANHDSEYDFAALEADVRILLEKFDSKIAGWFIDGVVQIRRAKERGLYEMARAKRELQGDKKMDRESYDEWRNGALERAAELGVERDVPTYDELQTSLEIHVARSEAGLPFLTPEHFRDVFAHVLDDLGRQATYVYASVAFGEFNGYSVIDLDKIIEGYITQVGQAFAKKSLWLVLKIAGHSPESIKEILPQVVAIVKNKGEKIAHQYLKYSYGASRRGSYKGLIQPGEKKTNVEKDKAAGETQGEPEPPPMDDPWTDYEFDNY